MTSSKPYVIAFAAQIVLAAAIGIFASMLLVGATLLLAA